MVVFRAFGEPSSRLEREALDLHVEYPFSSSDASDCSSTEKREPAPIGVEDTGDARAVIMPADIGVACGLVARTASAYPSGRCGMGSMHTAEDFARAAAMGKAASRLTWT
eukprot:CAMPEP_0181422502 /NCGR_PEP_ID=MMETSP1110-20121109/13645_2 /TAXON_ID=174948 /ORGANISM="Symbiodinium sp., Strain CCMP421" /LENGTH=109 /DNA_ID=CAMNT_0023545597 /DNA_START=154 /DNA_END=483 /DNA_ORIENTATION=-